MKSPRPWLRSVAVAVALAALGACTETANKVAFARLVVAADSAQALILVVSTDFDWILNVTTGSTTAFLNDVDSLSVPDGHDETYALDRADPRFYALLKNQHVNPQPVRMTVFLDDRQVYDVARTMAAGESLEYAYQFNSLTVSGN